MLRELPVSSRITALLPVSDDFWKVSPQFGKLGNAPRKWLWKRVFARHSQKLSQNGNVGAMANGKLQQRAASQRSP